MVSRGHKHSTDDDHLHDTPLQLLRSITKSHATNETSIVIDASNYIRKLKEKVAEKLNQEMISTTDTAKFMSMRNHNSVLPVVTVKSMGKGFLVNVHSGRSCSGLLVSILEIFEELGLQVLEASVSCAESFHLQATGGEDHNEEGDEESINAQLVKRAISNAIKNWRGSDGDH